MCTLIRLPVADRDRVNGWDIWQSWRGVWRVTRIAANGDYLVDATCGRTREDAVAFAQSHVPPDVAEAPAAPVVYLQPRPRLLHIL